MNSLTVDDQKRRTPLNEFAGLQRGDQRETLADGLMTFLLLGRVIRIFLGSSAWGRLLDLGDFVNSMAGVVAGIVGSNPNPSNHSD